MRLTRLLAVATLSSFVAIGLGCGGGGGGTDQPAVGPATAVAAVSGSGATVSASVTAPIALVAKVTDAAGHAISGASVTWSTGSGSISPAVASSDGNGQSTAQWTPGHTAGSQTANASVSGATTASFAATVTAGPLAKVTLTPDTTRLSAVGQTAQLTATGLDAFDNTVNGFAPSYAVVDPGVATVNPATGLLTAVGNGTTKVSAGSGVASASATVIVAIGSSNPCAGVTMTLAVGASQTLTGALANQFCVNGSAGAEYVAIPFYATGNGGTGTGQGTGANAFVAAPTLNVAFNPLVNTTFNGPPVPTILANAQPRAALVAGDATELTRDVVWEAKFRERARRELSPLMRAVRQAPRITSSGRNSLSISPAVNVGDALTLNVNVSSGCGSPTLVSAHVVATSTHAIVVNDDRNPTGFVTADYQAIASSFDSQVWPTDTDNFGVPFAFNNGTGTPVRDPNGKIILFFTIAVNQLTPANQSSFVGGFFFGRDLFPKVAPPPSTFTCSGSNESEMFYLLAPDPNGTINNNTRATSFVRSITTGTVAHEFQHLINAAYRLYVPGINFSSFEETFLDEGLAHESEELNYYAAAGKSPRTNIDAAGVSTPSDVFLAFARQNEARFREYLKNPEQYPPYSVLADTSLAVRGGIWSFLRYATDRRTGNGTSEKTTWTQLVNPTSDVAGLNNLKSVFGADVLSQMRDWSVANYLDDALGVSTPTAFQHPSWNTRSVETFVNGVNGNPGTTFPLKTFSLLSTQVPIGLADGGAAYLRFGVAAGAVGGATVTTSATLPTTFSITVVRTK